MCVRQCERWDLQGRRDLPPEIPPGDVIPHERIPCPPLYPSFVMVSRRDLSAGVWVSGACGARGGAVRRVRRCAPSPSRMTAALHCAPWAPLRSVQVVESPAVPKKLIYDLGMRRVGALWGCVRVRCVGGGRCCRARVACASRVAGRCRVRCRVVLAVPPAPHSRGRQLRRRGATGIVPLRQPTGLSSRLAPPLALQKTSDGSTLAIGACPECSPMEHDPPPPPPPSGPPPPNPQGFFRIIKNPTGGGDPSPKTPLPPSPDQSDHRGKKRNLQSGKSGQAIFGTPSFGSKTPSPPPPPPALKKPCPSPSLRSPPVPPPQTLRAQARRKVRHVAKRGPRTPRTPPSAPQHA